MADKNFGLFFTYVTFWPQLIAGPILRAAEVMPQLNAPRTWSPSFLSAGSALIVGGLLIAIVSVLIAETPSLGIRSYYSATVRRFYLEGTGRVN